MAQRKPKLDTYSYHEMTDRLHVTMVFLHENLTQHPVAKLNKPIQNLIDEAHNKLWEAYQLAGKIEFEQIEQ